ncbi:MAG: phosphate ABC transporter permease PstA [Phycisphaerae bacterium]|nr:phosphate ABC transporter permease PstA [Phycisphaerae bacterium]NNF41897.1 phosphate ABC transporter permease PstA [Phycisphaerales bacterium]
MTDRRRMIRTIKNRGFVVVCVAATSVSIAALAVLLFAVVKQGTKHLIGFDRAGVTADRAPQPPDEFTDLADVDWPALAASLETPALATLTDMPWRRLGRAQSFEYADEIIDVDWPAAADTLAWPELATLGTVDWDRALEVMTVPGFGRIAATWRNSEIGQFVTSPPSRRPERAGIGPSLAGTIWICAVCGLVALPLGVGTAIFLEEYRPKPRWARAAHAFVQLNISNLAGVPSIVYGIIGLTAFVQMFDVLGTPNDPWFTLGTPDAWYYLQVPFGRGVLAGGLTLMLVILPIVIVSAQEALRAVPDSLRQGSLALGSTRWQTIRRMTLPSAIPGIMTGSILAMSRAIGEAAPVLIICGIVFIRFLPQNVMDEFTALPLQIYDWAGRPQEDFHRVAASGILVLLAVLLTFNAIAIVIRQRFQKAMP